MAGYFTYTFTRTIPSTNTTATIPATCVTGGFMEWSRLDIIDPIILRKAVLTGRKPEDLPSINIGDVIAIITNGAPIGTQFQVADFRIIYGAKPELDTWEMQLECWLSKAGRSNATVTWTAGQTIWAANACFNASGLYWDQPIGVISGYQRVSAQTVTNANVLDTIRQVWNTEQGLMQSGVSGYSGGEYLFYVYPYKRASGTGTVTVAATFSDEGTAGTCRYEAGNLDFGGLADDYWTGVLVQPAGLTAQRAGTETRCYVLDTYDETTLQAAQTALFAKSRLSSADRTPLSLRFTWEQQGATVPSNVGVGSLVKIRFRSTDYYAWVNGVRWTFGPAQTAVELTLAPYVSGSFITLDDAVLGRLDYNKLSF